jgi:transposase, IS5 family
MARPSLNRTLGTLAGPPYDDQTGPCTSSQPGGQFVLHAKAPHGNPYAGDTLEPMIKDMEELTGIETRRIHVDKGYRGHEHPHKFRVWISGQVRRVTGAR